MPSGFTCAGVTPVETVQAALVAFPVLRSVSQLRT